MDTLNKGRSPGLNNSALDKNPGRVKRGSPAKSSLFFRRSISVARNGLMAARLFWFRRILKMDIHPSVKISLKAKLDFTNPQGVHIDAGTYVAFNSVILSHDMSRVLHIDTHIGKNCFIGACSIIMPGVKVGNQCIVGTGSVVVNDVPDYSIVAGNPARIIRSDIRTREMGILSDVHELVVASEKTTTTN